MRSDPCLWSLDPSTSPIVKMTASNSVITLTHWWYEDYDAFVQHFQEVEEHLATSTEASDLGRLFVIWQLMITLEFRGLLAKEIARSETRRAKLVEMHQPVADDTARPNNALQAKTSLSAFVRSGAMPPSTLRILHRLVWTELQLGRIPHVLQAMTWAAFAARQVVISEDRRARHAEKVQLQEAVLGIHLLNIPIAALPLAERMPDVLERLGLRNARLAILYALGHEKRIFAEKYFPTNRSKEELRGFFEQWLDQPAMKDLPRFPTLI